VVNCLSTRWHAGEWKMRYHTQPTHYTRSGVTEFIQAAFDNQMCFAKRRARGTVVDSCAARGHRGSRTPDTRRTCGGAPKPEMARCHDAGRDHGTLGRTSWLDPDRA